ncbi:uncharacterized protein LOC125757647 [Rhipicephalus sanguineus]|uniref:uncharacterized protein LOC125757647 n=1 Tax=Rhipicephalus sanguineus TaxID=34632 RepID=UPI0020C59352|nr:uncharacterized protein LOC125757647 [Rhipicephalus sanguineus]
MDGTTSDRPTIGAEGIATVQIHLPSFWPQNPAAWFTHVEAIFALRRITSQQAKYCHAVSALSTEVVAEFHDLVCTPHETTPYDHFKTTVLQRKSVSVRRRLQQLLNEEELGDRRPSELLRRMQQLLSGCKLDVNSPLLRELFFQRLPQNVVLALATAPDDLPLDKLAEQADRVADYAAGGTVATASSVPLSQLEDRQSRLEQLIDDLAETVNALRPPSHPRRRDRDYRPRLSPRSSSRSGPRRRVYCWYHSNFGASARQCRPPCSWQGNVPQSH